MVLPLLLKHPLTVFHQFLLLTLLQHLLLYHPPAQLPTSSFGKCPQLLAIQCFEALDEYFEIFLLECQLVRLQEVGHLLAGDGEVHSSDDFIECFFVFERVEVHKQSPEFILMHLVGYLLPLEYLVHLCFELLVVIVVVLIELVFEYLAENLHFDRLSAKFFDAFYG